MAGLYGMFRDARQSWLGRRWWIRLAVVFCLSWILFVVLCLSVAVAVGAYGEAAAFFTAKGVLVVLLFFFVFGAEGAILGGLVDLLKYLAKGGATQGPSGKQHGPGGV